MNTQEPRIEAKDYLCAFVCIRVHSWPNYLAIVPIDSAGAHDEDDPADAVMSSMGLPWVATRSAAKPGESCRFPCRGQDIRPRETWRW